MARKIKRARERDANGRFKSKSSRSNTVTSAIWAPRVGVAETAETLQARREVIATADRLNAEYKTAQIRAHSMLLQSEINKATPPLAYDSGKGWANHVGTVLGTLTTIAIVAVPALIAYHLLIKL